MKQSHQWKLLQISNNSLMRIGSRRPGAGFFFAVVYLVVWAVWETYADQARQLRIGHFPNLTHAQAVYARATGQFEKMTGTPIQWTSFNAGPSAIEAIFTDAIDMAFVGPNPAINGYMKSHGNKFVIIAGAASGGSGLVVRKDSGINSEKDFN